MQGREACPSEHALLDAVAEQRVAELADHLDACDECREVVAELARRVESGGDSARTHDAIGRFEIEQVLGSGAMGVVYLAYDPQLERKVALKVLHAPSAKRLVEEARALARLEHDHLVRIYGIEEVDGQLAIAMEYLGGGTLRGWTTTKRSWREVAKVMLGVARGLAAIHGAGLLHRDLKPDNILFDTRGRARIADLGLAKLHEATPEGLAGTIAYMAPELMDGSRASERSDQWSFFVVFHEALCGERPRDGTAAFPGPRTVQALVACGLEREPGKRHASMTDVARVLERVLRPQTPRLAIAGAAGIVGACAIGLALVAGSREHEHEPCAQAAEPIESVWNAAARMRLSAAYREAGMTGTGVVVTRGFDAAASTWAAAQTESCRATHVRGEQSAALLDRRTSCLRERLASLDSLIAQLAAAGTDRVMLARGGEALAGLAAVEECEPGRLAARVASTDPRAGEARIALARVRALQPLVETRKTIAAVEPVIALGTELRDHSLIAEAKLIAADALATDLQLEQARARFAEAELAAEAAHDDDLRSRALIAHAIVAGALLQKAADGEDLLGRARAVITRLGERSDLQRRALIAEAALAAARGDQRTGERVLREVLQTLPTTGSQRAMRAVALRDLANMLSEQGRHEEAATAAREAVAFAEATYGPDHADVAETLSLLALTLHFVNNDDEAQAFAARAIAIKERLRGPEHVSLSSTLMVQALIARDSKTAGGHAEARLATERAIALRRVAYGNDNPLVLALVSERGSLAVEAGEYAVARALFAEAVPGLVRAWGAASPAVTNAQQSEAVMAEQSGDPAQCAVRLAAIANAPIEVVLHRAHCLIDARSFGQATAILGELGKRDLDRATRDSADTLAARLAHARGDRTRARSMLVALDQRTQDLEPVLALDLAHVWALLGDRARAAVLADHALSSAGVDLRSSELYARAAEIAKLGGRRDDVARLVARAIAIATGASAGPDLLVRYRALRD